MITGGTKVIFHFIITFKQFDLRLILWVVMVAHCPPQHCRFSKGELNQIMQTCSPSLTSTDCGSTLPTKYYSWSHLSVSCCFNNSSYRRQTHAFNPVWEANFQMESVAAWSCQTVLLLKEAANAFLYGLCFSVLKPRFIFLF